MFLELYEGIIKSFLDRAIIVNEIRSLSVNCMFPLRVSIFHPGNRIKCLVFCTKACNARDIVMFVEDLYYSIINILFFFVYRRSTPS